MIMKANIPLLLLIMIILIIIVMIIIVVVTTKQYNHDDRNNDGNQATHEGPRRGAKPSLRKTLRGRSRTPEGWMHTQKVRAG